MKKSTIILITMLAAATVAVIFGLYIMQQRISTPPTNTNQTQNTSDQTPAPAPTPTPADTTPVASTVGWKTYTNDKHAFTVLYPPYLKAGAVSDNSVLGTFQVPVRGLHVGPLVLVALEDKSLQKDAKEYFDSFYNSALNPPAQQTPESQAGGCTIDNVTNTNVVSIKSVSCTGEGGVGKYAYITGKTYDVFVDGYSKGFDDSGSGDFTNNTDYLTVLSTFIFTKDVVSSISPTPNPTAGAATTTKDNTATAGTTPSIKTFTVNADDSSATPNMIMVPTGTIVEITFNVATANVYNGGLDFRSSVVNSGTVHAGESKTISFTANKSFDFTPYWPASQTAKPYKVSVMLE